MGRERRSSIEDYERTGSYTSPNTNRNKTRSRTPIHSSPTLSGHNYSSPRSRRSRSPRREERYSRTESHSRRRSRSGGRKPRYGENIETKKPAYGGPKNPLILDSNIQISVNSRRSSSPVRPSSSNRIVIVRPRGEEKSHNSNTSDRGMYERKFSRHDRKYDSPSPSRRRISPPRGHREIRRRSHESRNRRNEVHANGRDRPREDRRVNSSRDRRHENPRSNDSSSVYSSRRNGYGDKSDRERNATRKRRYSKDNRQDDEYSHSGRRKSYDTSEERHEDEPESSENGNENEDKEDAVDSNNGPLAVGIRPPVWPPMIPFRPPPIFLPPRPVISPMGFVLPPRPPFMRFPRPPAIYFPPRPLPPPPPAF